MVGPVGEEERSAAATRIKIAFTLLVGASAGLITLQGDPSPLVVAAAVGAGLVLGWVLIWYVYPDRDTFGRDGERRRRFD